MPGNGMDFSFDSFANRVVAVVIGLSCVVMGFRLLPGLGTRLRRRRLINAISTDIHELSQRSIRDAETRFSGHMADSFCNWRSMTTCYPKTNATCLFLA